MNHAKSLPLVLFAFLAGGCVGEELVVPYSLEVGEPLPVVTELEPEEPGDPGEPEPAPEDPDFTVCGSLLDVEPDSVIVGDVSITSVTDLAVLGEVVVVTGNVDVAIDEVVDFDALEQLRCIGGDVRIRNGGAFSLDHLPNLELIGGAFVSDEDDR